MLPSCPTGLVLLNSRGYWPTIQLLEAVHRQSPLKHILILQPEYREDDHGLAQFCICRYGLEPDVLPVSSLNPTQLLQTLAHAGVQHRIVNLTGGRKLLFGALLQIFLTHPETTLLYRHLERGWLRLKPTLPVFSVEPFPLDERAVDALPLPELLEPMTGAMVTHEAPQALPLQAIVEAGLQHGWHWGRMASIFGHTTAGHFFEQVVASFVQAMGVRHVATNLVLRSAEGTTLAEIDLAFIHGGRLHLIDCKLQSLVSTSHGRPRPISAQIRELAALRNRLGDPHARALLLRPTYRIPLAFRELAEEAYGLTVLDATDNPRLLPALARFVGTTLPSDLQALQERLEHETRKGSPPFAPVQRSFAHSRPAFEGQPDTSRILQSNLETSLASRSEVIIHLHGALYAVGVRSPKARQRLESLKANLRTRKIGVPIQAYISKSGRTGWLFFKLQANADALEAFAETLSSHEHSGRA